MVTDTSNLQTIEGTVPFHVRGETFQTWYKVFGDLKIRKSRPLVVLHGGPGMSHDYMLPVSDLVQSASIPVIFYDQLGSARSTHLAHKGAGFWTIDLFIDELLNLLSHFDISDDFDVLGHSWGGIVGAEFAVRRQPSGLKHLILADAPADMRLRNESHARLRKRLGEDVQGVLQEHEKAGSTSSPQYLEAMTKFYAKFLCPVQPMPQSLVFSLEQSYEQGTANKYMRAKTGDLRTWCITDRLNRISVPTLVVNGRHDMVQDFVSAPFFWKINKVKWVIFTESSHMPHWEERERFMEEVVGFLSDGRI